MKEVKGSEKLLEIHTNKMIIEIGYRKFVVGHEEGLAILHNMAKAEIMDGYGEEAKIIPIEPKDFQVSPMAEGYYLACKMHTLLGVPVDPETMNDLEIIDKREEEKNDSTVNA